MSDIKYEIKKNLGVLSESQHMWSKEVNLISWNGHAPKLDIRDWAPEHSRMGKGITLTKMEAKYLRDILNEMEL